MAQRNRAPAAETDLHHAGLPFSASVDRLITSIFFFPPAEIDAVMLAPVFLCRFFFFFFFFFFFSGVAFLPPSQRFRRPIGHAVGEPRTLRIVGLLQP
ncbi:MAG: hypothetical protein IPP85_09070 [Propionivibrio sp.]|nr:hypothetical protein [Propionivibrio sp.]